MRNLLMAGKFGNLWGVAKLTDDQVREIRQLYAAGKHTQQDLAGTFGVSRGHISKVVNGDQWKQCPRVSPT